MYQGRYCKGSDWDHVDAGKWQYSLKECADKCVGNTWKQFIYGTGGKCKDDGRCECFCYMKDASQCTSWETGQEYIQYAFNEPGS